MSGRYQRLFAAVASLAWLIGLLTFGASFAVVFLGLLILAIGGLVASYQWQAQGRGGRLVPWLRRAAVTAVLLWLVSLGLVLRMIFSTVEAAIPPTARYLVILGAGLRDGDQLSLILQSRLETARERLQRHPQMQVIVSGGQGPDERLSEAAAMRQWLVEHGIAASRILTEDRSTTTRENLRFSRALLPPHPGPVVVVSSDFHVYRARRIAVREGLDCIVVKAPTPAWVLVNYATREYFAILKDIYIR